MDIKIKRIDDELQSAIAASTESSRVVAQCELKHAEAELDVETLSQQLQRCTDRLQTAQTTIKSLKQDIQLKADSQQQLVNSIAELTSKMYRTDAFVTQAQSQLSTSDAGGDELESRQEHLRQLNRTLSTERSRLKQQQESLKVLLPHIAATSPVVKGIVCITECCCGKPSP